MEAFEAKAELDPLKSLLHRCHVDDTLLIWQHGQETLLDQFVDDLNSIYSSIKFTKEQEQEGRLAFLDIIIIRQADGSLGRSVFRKAVHTDVYLNSKSHHHPT